MTTMTVTAPPPLPLVSVTSVGFVRNKKHLVTSITVEFSGALNVTEADSLATYRLATAGKHGSFNAKNAGIVKLKSAVFVAGLNEVILTPRKPFALTKPVQLRINGLPPSGLQDTLGRLIDGNHDGQAGGNAVAMLRPKGATVSARIFGPSGGGSVLQATAEMGLNPDDMSGMSQPAGPVLSKHRSTLLASRER
jgi:hypothetical protein